MTLFKYFIVAVTVFYINNCRVESKAFCSSYHFDTNCMFEEPTCEYEIVTDFCGRKVCTKGPDERCGGLFNFMGVCANGLQCKCNKCSGCALRNLGCSKTKEICIN